MDGAFRRRDLKYRLEINMINTLFCEDQTRNMVYRTSRKRKQPATQDQKTILYEKVNVGALRELAGRRAAGMWRPNVSGPTLRKIISDFLAQVREGNLPSAWREEERMQSLGLIGRRYSGYTQGEEISIFEQHIANGVNSSSVGKSLFSLPGWLRDIGRCGLHGCFVVDMCNAHPVIQHKRHPSLPGIKEYVKHREKVLNTIPTSRDAAKNLFIRLVYDGSVEQWCKENHVETTALPQIVWQFRNDQREVRRLDEASNQELFAKLKTDDPVRASELLQYVLNTQEERRVVDAVAQAVANAGGEVMAFEHDGLYVKYPKDEETLKASATVSTNYPFTVNTCGDWDSLFELVKARITGDWGTIDECWSEKESLAREASVAKLQHHDLFATVLMNEPCVDASTPWPISDLFKLPVNAANYVWYDVQRHVWVEGGANGVWRLKEYITQMLQRRLSEYELGDHLTATIRSRFEYGNKQFRDGVESCLRSKLIADDTFQLDPESSLRYLNFDGQVL